MTRGRVEFVPDPTGRQIGTCPVCEKRIRLDDAGKVGEHKRHTGRGARQIPCRGRGKEPTGELEPAMVMQVRS